MGIRWPQSGTIARDNDDRRNPGCVAYFYVGGTTTPLPTYEDIEETTAHEHPVEADANGRWPLVFIPYIESYDEKVVTSGGEQLAYFQRIPNFDPIEAAVDAAEASQLLQTGQVVWEPTTGTREGFLRLNARTFGNSSSGGTERADDDTEDLFTYYWNRFSNTISPVSGGRGASAAADFAANKTITLLDGRSGVLRGLDTMGNSAASRLTAATFVNGSSSTSGSALGSNVHALSTAELASHAHVIASGSVSTSSNGGHTPDGTVDGGGGFTPAGTVDSTGSSHSHTVNSSAGTTGSGGAHTPDGTADSGGTHVHTGLAVASAGDHSHTYTLSGSNFQAAIASGLDFQNTLAPGTATSTAGAHEHDFHASMPATGTHGHTLTMDPVGDHSHTVTIDSSGAHTHTFSGTPVSNHTHPFTGDPVADHSHTVSGTTNSNGSGTAHNNVSYGLLGTFFQKL